MREDTSSGKRDEEGHQHAAANDKEGRWKSTLVKHIVPLSTKSAVSFAK
jgi:hypothetical protein